MIARSPTYWVTVEPEDVFDSIPSSSTAIKSSKLFNQQIQGASRYRLQKSSEAGSTSTSSQIEWWHEHKPNSTHYQLRSKESALIKPKSSVAGAQRRGLGWRKFFVGILAFLCLCFFWTPALNFLCKDPNRSGIYQVDRFPRPPLTNFLNDHFKEKINSINRKFSEIQSANKNVCDFYFTLSNSTGAVQKLRSSVQHSTMATRVRILLGLNQYIANARINGKLQGNLRTFVTSVSNNRERVELYSRTVFEAISHLKEPPSLASNYPELCLILYWPSWIPLDHFGEHSNSSLYLVASHIDEFVANTKLRSEKSIRLAQNLRSTLLEQISHLDGLFTNPGVVDTSARISEAIKTGQKAEPEEIDVAIISRPPRRLSRLWVQTGGEELDEVSEALDWTDGALPQIVNTVQGTIQSLNEIAVRLDEIQIDINNLRDVA